MNESDIYKVDNLKALIRDSYLVATKCHEILFKRHDDNRRNELIAAHHLNKAISLMYAAKAVYISCYEILEKQEVENIFYAFNVFESEFLRNLETDHSHQWSELQYNKFKDSVTLLLGDI